jgi:hypothetical protein
MSDMSWRRPIMPSLRAFSLSVLSGAVLAGWAAPGANAQSPVCLEGAKLLEARGGIIQSLAPKGKQKMTPDQACSRFSSLVANGQKVISWLDANAAWCNVPEQIGTKVRDDHKQAITVRGRACGMAAQYRRMQAQQRAAQQGGGVFGGAGGGDIVSGQMRVPAPAL